MAQILDCSGLFCSFLVDMPPWLWPLCGSDLVADRRKAIIPRGMWAG